mmetsp:Transcript_89421/g.158707  ORF Transcript_89421/g.158707 Transcript_89421/m.158707 type:complete len:268 (-) Transcript_89421:1120-1923(-)
MTSSFTRSSAKLSRMADMASVSVGKLKHSATVAALTVALLTLPGFSKDCSPKMAGAETVATLTPLTSISTIPCTSTMKVAPTVSCSMMRCLTRKGCSSMLSTSILMNGLLNPPSFSPASIRARLAAFRLWPCASTSSSTRSSSSGYKDSACRSPARGNDRVSQTVSVVTVAVRVLLMLRSASPPNQFPLRKCPTTSFCLPRVTEHFPIMSTNISSPSVPSCMITSPNGHVRCTKFLHRTCMKPCPQSANMLMAETTPLKGANIFSCT